MSHHLGGGQFAAFRPGATCGILGPMPKIKYRILVRKDGQTCDVEMKHGPEAPRIVNTFNSEAEAWEWVNEQKQINKFASREAAEGPGKPPDKPKCN